MDTTELLLDQRGEIACRDHTPFPGSDTWSLDDWRPMPVGERDEFQRELGRPATCETCAAIARNRRAS